MDSSIEIEERAGAWLAKRDRGEWSAEDQQRFTQWLNAATAHRVAFLRLEEMWTKALKLQALGAGVPRRVVPSPDDRRFAALFEDREVESVPARRRTWKFIAWAAGILAAVALGVLLQGSPWGTSYYTPVGGIASVPMSDGSKVTLNTDTAIHLAVTAQERRVQLDRGEAFFEVARDAKRPFVVVAGDRRIVAVRTQFSVRRVHDQVEVLVSEGRVRIEKADTTETEGFLSAGEAARAGKVGMLTRRREPAEVEDYLSWRSGHLVFRELPLAEAVEEFNRYNESKIVIQDAAVGAINVSGKIRPTNAEAFLRLLEDTFPVQAQRSGGRIVLTGRP